jgi:hypothetical protein
VDRIASEAVRLAGPGFADGLEGCEATKGVEALGEVGGGQEGADVLSTAGEFHSGSVAQSLP